MAKWKKVAAVTTVSAMTIQLAACGSEEASIEEASEITYTSSEVIEDTGSYEDVTPEEILDGDVAGIEHSEYFDACADWAEQEDGSYVCDDEYSTYHGQHFFDGLMYATIGAMVASSYYKSKNKISGTKREEQSSGGGGYSSSGSSSSSSKGTSGATSTSGGTTNASTSTSSSGTSTSTTEQNKAGTTKPSNGTTNYSSGKSGFSSGGTSRGGSSSS
ncbi:hypothetical protein [Lysinibacillus sp. LZ02]|uniref:hypothetical protein n=1 Tax=Lysinibacillus sp. LZ02 TaxID=3420668 RepID=UPI003D35F973